MYEKIKPLHDRVLIKRLELDNKTPGGLYIPDNATKEKAQTGQVIATGIGKVLQDGKIIPLQVKVGDMVYFGKYAGAEAGDDHLIIREDEILGIVEK